MHVSAEYSNTNQVLPLYFVKLCYFAASFLYFMQLY